MSTRHRLYASYLMKSWLASLKGPVRVTCTRLIWLALLKLNKRVWEALNMGAIFAFKCMHSFWGLIEKLRVKLETIKKNSCRSSFEQGAACKHTHTHTPMECSLVVLPVTYVCCVRAPACVFV